MKIIFYIYKTLLIALFSLVASIAYAQEGGVEVRAKSEKLIKAKAPKRLQRSELLRERLSFSFGAFYSQGDYGTNKATSTFSIPLRVSYSRRDWRVSAQMPYMYVDGPAAVFAISDGVEIVEKFAEGKRWRWGNGDLRISAQHQIFRSSKQRSSLYAGLTIKVPIAHKDENLGSGEFDYSLFAGGHMRFGKWIGNARIGYQLMGDTEITDYNNRFYASLGGHYRFDKLNSIGVNAYYKQQSIDSSDPIQTLSTNYNLRLREGWRASFSLGTGFTEASSDLFGGLQFTKSFVRKRRVVKGFE